MASPSVAAVSSAPPSYRQAAKKNGDSGSTNNARQGGAAPVPHFDSILRAAPAFDDDLDDLDNLIHGSPCSSSLSLPEQVDNVDIPHWSAALRPHLQYHASLHAYLDANARLEERIIATTEQIHIDAGKFKSTLTRVTRLETELAELHMEGDKKSKMFWPPKRRKIWRERVHAVQSALIPMKETLEKADDELRRDRAKLQVLEQDFVEYKKVESRLDAVDDEVFGGPSEGQTSEDEFEQQYHVLIQTQRRLLAVAKQEVRAQGHLTKSYQLLLGLIKELLAGLNIGIEIGVPTNQKHKTGLWKGTSSTYSANLSRNHILRAKTLAGDLYTNYLLARGVQKRVAVMSKLHVIDLNRLPGMNGKNVVNEAGLHRSLEQSYAQAKIVKAQIEGQQRQSRERQAAVKRAGKDIANETREVWLELRKVRRTIVQDYSVNHGAGSASLLSDGAYDGLPPYKRNIISRSTFGLHQQQQQRDAISLPKAFRRRVDRESVIKCRAIVREIAIQVGGVLTDDDVNTDEYENEEQDLPGLELIHGY